MVNCSAYGCTNRSTVHPELSFHKLPSMKNKILRQRWLHNIRREGELPKDASFRICSSHFEDACFERDLQVILTMACYLYLLTCFIFFN